MKTENLPCAKSCPYKLPGETELSCGQGFATGADQKMYKCDETREELLLKAKQQPCVTATRYTAGSSSATIYVTKIEPPSYNGYKDWTKVAFIRDGKVEWSD